MHTHAHAQMYTHTHTRTHTRMHAHTQCKKAFEFEDVCLLDVLLDACFLKARSSSHTRIQLLIAITEDGLLPIIIVVWVKSWVVRHLPTAEHAPLTTDAFCPAPPLLRFLSLKLSLQLGSFRWAHCPSREHHRVSGVSASPLVKLSRPTRLASKMLF